MINEYPPKMTEKNREMWEQTNKMNRYTETCKVEGQLRYEKPEPKKNSIFGKVS
mgnify:CR=1 FL=1